MSPEPARQSPVCRGTRGIDGGVEPIRAGLSIAQTAIPCRGISPPEVGKSMLARRLTSILAAMTRPDALETTRIHSVAGLTGDRTALATARPFRAPHHTIPDVGLIGGGSLAGTPWHALAGCPMGRSGDDDKDCGESRWRR
jgi:hypothetical protein